MGRANPRAGDYPFGFRFFLYTVHYGTSPRDYDGKSRENLAMRRIPFALALLGLSCLVATGQEERGPADRLATRYGITVNPLSYPQSTPQEALQSIVRAMATGRLEYL